VLWKRRSLRFAREERVFFLLTNLEKEANERRKKAAAEAEKELEKQRAEVMAKQSAQLSALAEKRKNSLAQGNPCRKCKFPLKPGALFCTKCGEKFEVRMSWPLVCLVYFFLVKQKSTHNLVSLLNSFNTSTDQLLSGDELRLLKEADEEYAKEVARVKVCRFCCCV
jgi:hypothetical protein